VSPCVFMEGNNVYCTGVWVYIMVFDWSSGDSSEISE
jgi:hypothetical protein